MNRKTQLIFVSGATIAVLGACSHTASRRIPANDSPLMIKYSATFGLVNDSEVERTVRIYKGGTNSKVARVSAHNAEGMIFCQIGQPEETPAVNPRMIDYVFEPKQDEDIYCYSTGTVPTASVTVDYFAPRASASWNDVKVVDFDKLQGAIRDVTDSHFVPDTRVFLGSVGLVSTTKITAAPGQVSDGTGTPIQVSPGDLLEINAVEGGLGTTKHALEKTPLLANGLVAPKPPKLPAVPAATAAQLDPPVRPNKAYIFAAERPHRLICTLQAEDGVPTIIYRGGEELLSFSDKEGTFTCQLNEKKKKAEKILGGFAVTVSTIKKADALAQLILLSHSREEAKAAFERQLDDQTLSSVQNAVGNLIATDVAVLSHYNHLLQSRAKAIEEARLTHEHERQLTATIFADQYSAQYRRGAHSFSIVPVKWPLPTSHGMVDYVKYTIQNGSTQYYPKDETRALLSVKENVFAPFQEVLSDDKWNGSPVTENFVACPKSLEEMSAELGKIAGTVVKREKIIGILKAHSDPAGSDCLERFASWRGHLNYEFFTFRRTGHFHFVYKKVSTASLDGLDRIDVVTYVPARIEAQYLSANGAQDSKVVTSLATAIGQEIPFFGTGLKTAIRFSDSDALPSEKTVETTTLLPPYKDGMIAGFSLY